MLPQVYWEVLERSWVRGYGKNLGILIDKKKRGCKCYKSKTDNRFPNIFCNPRKYGRGNGGYHSNNKGCTFSSSQYQKQNYKKSARGRPNQICRIEFASHGRECVKSSGYDDPDEKKWYCKKKHEQRKVCCLGYQCMHDIQGYWNKGDHRQRRNYCEVLCPVALDAP